MSSFLTNYNITAEIGVSLSDSTWTYATLGAGIDNVSEALNEVVQQYQFLNGQGYAENHVTGAAPAWTFSGRRILGDTAQDYIAGLKYEFDDARKSSLKISYTKGDDDYEFVVPVTICNIVDIGGGASTDDSVFSCEIRFDGKPTFKARGLRLTATAVSQGATTITVAGAPTGSAAFYKIGNSIEMPYVGTSASDLTGWTQSMSNSSIAVSGATAGTKITVVATSGGLGGGEVLKGGTVVPA